jgi:hypothetical protein
MSRVQLSTSNPFALLMDPQSVFDAIEKSERLERLHSRICLPLDKQILPSAAAEDDDPDNGRLDLMDLPGEEI